MNNLGLLSRDRGEPQQAGSEGICWWSRGSGSEGIARDSVILNQIIAENIHFCQGGSGEQWLEQHSVSYL